MGVEGSTDYQKGANVLFTLTMTTASCRDSSVYATATRLNHRSKPVFCHGFLLLRAPLHAQPGCCLQEGVHPDLLLCLNSHHPFKTCVQYDNDPSGLPSFCLVTWSSHSIYSNYTLSFHGCAQVFKNMVMVLQEYVGNMKIRWKFTADRAPSWGGWWERLIRSAKNALGR